jgi:hypothetical protein
LVQFGPFLAGWRVFKNLMGVGRPEALKTKASGAAAKMQDVKKADFYGEPSDWLPIGGLGKRRKSSCAGTGARAFSAHAGTWKEVRYA